VTTPTRSPLTALLERFLPRLRYPWLVLALGGLLLVDLVVPDPLPFVDELALALLTFIAASLRSGRADRPPPRDITPPDETADEPRPGSARLP
jgi:hypothetical protein